MPKNPAHGRHQSVEWREGGRLFGDAAFVAEIAAEAALLSGRDIGPEEGPYTRYKHLSSPISAGIVIASLMVGGTVTVSGDVPERPAIPEGAKG